MSPTILVVDDDAAIRCLLALALEDAGYEVEEAGDGLGALELLRQRRPDLILTDVRMPHLDGIGLARLLEPVTPPIPLILMSAQPCPLDCFLPFLRKPFDLETLLTLVARLLPVPVVTTAALDGLGAI